MRMQEEIGVVQRNSKVRGRRDRSGWVYDPTYVRGVEESSSRGVSAVTGGRGRRGEEGVRVGRLRTTGGSAG